MATKRKKVVVVEDRTAQRETAPVKYNTSMQVRMKRTNCGGPVVSVGSVNERCEKNHKCVSLTNLPVSDQ